MLTVALPKGRLLPLVVARLGALAPAAEDLESRRLQMERGELRFLALKPDDVATYVERGAADLGICGWDVLEERGADVLVPVDLEIGRCRLSLCGPPGLDPYEIGSTGTLRVASKYVRLAGRALQERGLHADLVRLSGSVEVAVAAGIADAIVDLVETGRTLHENGLEELEELYAVSARVVVNRAAFRLRRPELLPLLDQLARPVTP